MPALSGFWGAGGPGSHPGVGPASPLRRRRSVKIRHPRKVPAASATARTINGSARAAEIKMIAATSTARKAARSKSQVGRGIGRMVIAFSSAPGSELIRSSGIVGGADQFLPIATKDLQAVATTLSYGMLSLQNLTVLGTRTGMASDVESRYSWFV